MLRQRSPPNAGRQGRQRESHPDAESRCSLLRMDTSAEHPGPGSRAQSGPSAADPRWPAPGEATDSKNTVRWVPRAVELVTAIAAGLLVLLHAADLLQGVLGLPLIAHDVWPMAGGPSPSQGDMLDPRKLVQTAVLMILSVAALLGGLICLGRRRGAARIAGWFAMLAVVLPLTTPLLLAPLSTMVRRVAEASPWVAELVYTGLPSLVSASGLIAGAVATILLLRARPQEAQLSGIAVSVVGIVCGAVFALEALAALIRQSTAVASWWGLGWSGMVNMGPVVALLMCLLLVAVMVSAGVGSGLLLGSASLLTRLGGGLLGAALVARVATQVLIWGIGYQLQVWAAATFDYSRIWPIEWTNAVAVPLFAVPGILLAVIGLFTGPKRTAAAPAGRGASPVS